MGSISINLVRNVVAPLHIAMLLHYGFGLNQWIIKLMGDIKGFLQEEREETSRR